MLERNDRIRSRVHTRCVDRHLAKEEASSEFADAQTVCEELIYFTKRNIDFIE